MSPSQCLHAFQNGGGRQVTNSQPVYRTQEVKILVDEDFSRFTDGSPEEPAPDITSWGKPEIPEELTAQPGWIGRGVHPAGGCVVLMEWPTDETNFRGGCMSTPPFLLNGTATLTFRAKKYGDEPATMWIALCTDYGPGEDSANFVLTDEWQTFTVVATNGDLTIKSYFQIMADTGSAFLDDVKLTFQMDRLASPARGNAVNLSPTSFKAIWGEVPDAEGYLLTLQCKEAPTVIETGEILESFEGINLSSDGKNINLADPSYPEGWTIDVSTHGTQDATTDPAEISSGSQALMFDAVGDFIESPDMPLPLDGVSFWAKPIGPDDTDYGYMSLIKVELYKTSTKTWDHVANLYYADFEKNNGVYTLDPMIFTDDMSRIRLSMLQEGKKKFFIDDIRLHYRTRGTITTILDDEIIETTEYVVSDINPANEYEYYVKAFCGDIVSAPNYPVWVDGVAGLKVESYEASDVTSTSFKASWNQLGHATDYTISLKKVVTPDTDLEGVVVLEENFNNITEGTVENPGTDWMLLKDFGAAGWTATPWCSTQPAWANGMIGTTGTHQWLGSAGLIFTPTLDLSCHDGSGITADATFVTTVSSFLHEDAEENEGIFAMLMNNYTDREPLAFGLLETPEAGYNSGQITIKNIPEDADLSNVIIAFMNKSGKTFFIDDVKITMNVPAGKSLITPLEVLSVQDTSHAFENLDPSFDHAYQVIASVTHNFYYFESNPSDMQIVRNSQAGIDSVEADPIEAEAEYFNLEGLRVSADAFVPGIYIERRGTVTRKIFVR